MRFIDKPFLQPINTKTMKTIRYIAIYALFTIVGITVAIGAPSDTTYYYYRGNKTMLTRVDPIVHSPQQVRSANETEAGYIFENEGLYVALTKELIVRLKEGVAYSEIERLLSGYSGVEIQQDRFDSRQYFITLKENPEPEVLNIANRLFETGLFEYAVPNFVHLDALQGAAPNDMLYYMQWNLKNNANQGLDIHAEDAWDITEGSPAIKIGLIDIGVDYNHEDLYNNLLPGYDVTGENTNGNITDEVYWHGTACAGVMVAQKGNVKGIAGIAPNCKVVSIRFDKDGRSVTDKKCVDAINTAWQEAKVDVISNSWSIGKSDAVDNAIKNAVSKGRGGKGCVVVFSSGNNNSSTITGPAALSEVITVGAIDRNGIRYGDPGCEARSDGGTITTGSGSNHGEKLDVVAPGINIYSTFPNGDYRLFSETSSACPHVAGIAALLLSFNPELTQQQVRSAIESTAQKVGSYTYADNTNHPQGKWNSKMGYGLVDAHAALLKICANIKIENTTITGNVSLKGCDDVHIQNATMKNGASLSIETPGNLLIDKDFIMEPNTSINVNQ